MNAPSTNSATADRMTIGELATRSGVAVKTIRFYEDEQLLPDVDRSPAGYAARSPRRTSAPIPGGELHRPTGRTRSDGHYHAYSCMIMLISGGEGCNCNDP